MAKQVAKNTPKKAELERRISRWQTRLAAHEEQVRQLYRWSVGALLTVNAGGLAITMASTIIPTNAQFFGSLWFFLGLATTILFVLAFTKCSEEVANELNEAFELCDEYIHDNATEDEIREKHKESFWERALNWTEKILYVAFLFFLVGSMVVGFGIKP